jgi:hypothetical protein
MMSDRLNEWRRPARDATILAPHEVSTRARGRTGTTYTGQPSVDLQIQQAVDVDFDNRIRILDIDRCQHIHARRVVPRFHLKGGLWRVRLDQPLELSNGGLQAGGTQVK